MTPQSQRAVGSLFIKIFILGVSLYFYYAEYLCRFFADFSKMSQCLGCDKRHGSGLHSSKKGLMEIIIAGIRSREEGGRKVSLDEIKKEIEQL